MHPELVSLNESGNKVRLGLVIRTGTPAEPGNEASRELALGTGAQQESLGTRLAMSLHSILVFISEAQEQGWPGIVLRTGAHQGNLGTRLALGVYSVLVLNRGAGERGYTVYMLTRGAWNAASPGIVLGTGAPQGDLGTRLALGVSPYWCSPGEPGNKDIYPLVCTQHWCSLGEPGNEASPDLFTALVLTRGAW